MARRRKDGNGIEVIGGLFGILMLLGLVSPTFRAVTIGIGRWLPIILLVAVAVLVGFLVIYKCFRNLRSPGYPALTERSSISISAAVPAPEPPQTSENLIPRLRTIDWFQFEKLVELVYRKLGYSVQRRGGANPDGGIDLIIEKNSLKTAVQCKHWRTWNVGVKAVREFLGALKDAEIHSGIFITLEGYTGDAKNLAERHGIQIVNETGLMEMIEETGASSDSEILTLLNDKRKFCPKCESQMVLKTARRGFYTGKQFWGCSRCRFIMKTPRTS